MYGSALKDNPNIHCFYVTTGNYERTDHIENLVEARKKQLSDKNIFQKISIHLIGARQLQMMYRTASVSVSVEIEFPKNQTMPLYEGVDEALIGYIPASEIIKLCGSFDESGKLESVKKSVFFDNIRDFDVTSKINQEIISSIENGDKRGFVFRNNGITVVAKKISRTGDKFILEDYQIVNGCQTSNILILCHDHIDGIHVPFRIIGSKDEDFIASIIIGTNKQNPVRDEQFWALRPFMKSLEEYCRNQSTDEVIYFERRENQYRGQQIERVRIIKPPELMKAVAAIFLYQPNRAARDYRGIRSEFEGSLFQDDHDVRIYHLACLASYRIDFLFRNKRISNDFKIFRYYILFSIGYCYCEAQDIFSLNSKKVNQSISELTSILKDEEKLIRLSETVGNFLHRMITERALDSREKMRDALRSETFRDSFKKEFSNLALERL